MSTATDHIDKKLREQTAATGCPLTVAQIETAADENGRWDGSVWTFSEQGLILAVQQAIRMLPALPIDFKQATDQGGWQPIATAPQSGKDILLFWRTAGVALGRFTYDEQFDERPRGWKSPEFGWRCDGDQVIPRNQKDCTHWMPLPAAPTLLGVADGDAVDGKSGGAA